MPSGDGAGKREPKPKRKPIDQVFDGTINSNQKCLFCRPYENAKRKQRYWCMRLPSDPREDAITAKMGIEVSVRTDFSGEVPCSWGDMLRCPLVGVDPVAQSL
jgi:hypothetical protein